ncbi:hypothetical protein BDZ97DRAFT_1916681 [Flammula alnicola]|nr:hypothetical protein BDZ97DRAFT_1916681 [Flammula alnicola]
MSDSASVRSSSRVSTFLNRPHIAPMGPRTRQSSLRASHILENGLTSPPLEALDLPEFGEPSIASARKSLPPLTEEPSSPDTAPAYYDELPAASSSQVQVPPAAKVVAVVAPPPKLTPPPAIKFETTPVPWKGLPMEAAMWTVDSQELQGIVSRAIRSSARESFIRLLTVENLDTVLPAELARLDSLKALTQSKYRFLVHRRTMLFHALNSTTLGQQKDGSDGVSVVATLASQLADTIAECDKHLDEIIKINDQVAQINKLIDIHWGSALAIALRKLNTSYARRTADLTAAKERIAQLEAELEDAWKEAEKMAGELDDYEAAIAEDDAEAVIETAEIVPVPKSTIQNRRSSIPLPMTPTLLAFTSVHSTTPKSPLSPASPTSPSSPHFTFPPPVHLNPKETEAADVPDTVSIRSTRSTRSGKSTRSHRSAWTAESNHTTSVHAAKRRSHRRSESSLRLNTGHTRKHSSGRAKTPHEEYPPVPELPLQFSSFNGVMSSSSANASSAILHFDPRISPSLRRQASLDSVRTGGYRSPTSPEAYRGRAADDLYLRLKSQNPSASEIQLVPRTPVPAQNFASMYHTYTAPPRPPPRDPSKSIPSIWMNADAVKPQMSQPSPTSSPQTSTASSDRAEPSGAMNRQNSARSRTYSKLRGLTKRYSISLPLFSTKTSQQTRSTSRRSG